VKRKCPNCGREIGAEQDPKWRPFCSERCRLIDLGEWIAGRRSIPSEETAPVDDTPPLKH